MINNILVRFCAVLVMASSMAVHADRNLDKFAPGILEYADSYIQNNDVNHDEHHSKISTKIHYGKVKEYSDTQKHKALIDMENIRKSTRSKNKNINNHISINENLLPYSYSEHKSVLDVDSKIKNIQEKNQNLDLQIKTLKEREVVLSNKEKDEKSSYESQIKKLKDSGYNKNTLSFLKIKPSELWNDFERENYAVGVAFGNEVLRAIEFKKLINLSVNKNMLLAGIYDSLNEKIKLNKDVFLDSLHQSQIRIKNAQKSTSDLEKSKGIIWLKKWLSNNKNACKHKTGFWYLIDYAGHGDFINKSDDLVEVSVVESLIDGTIVEDMTVSGKTLTMRLADYPSTFRNAISLLKDHGSITIVAPSFLAYGDEGYPPKIPPGAMLLYKLRVESVRVPEL